MKTLPIINLSRYDHQNTLLRECIRRENKKPDRILFVTPLEQKREPIELISDKENEKILKTMKQINKEFFGI